MSDFMGDDQPKATIDPAICMALGITPEAAVRVLRRLSDVGLCIGPTREANAYSGLITQAALASQLKATLDMAQASPHWPETMRKGAQALAANLIATFQLREHMP